MKALFLILLAVALLFYTKISLNADYHAGNFSVTVSALWIKKALLPKEKKRKEKPKQSLAQRYLSLNAAIKAYNKIKKSIVIENLRISFISADADPFNAVMKYNAANAFAFSLFTYLESCHKIENREIDIDTDMTAVKSTLDAAARLSLRLGLILYAVSVYMLEMLKFGRRSKNGKQAKRNDAVGNEQRQAAG